MAIGRVERPRAWPWSAAQRRCRRPRRPTGRPRRSCAVARAGVSGRPSGVALDAEEALQGAGAIEADEVEAEHVGEGDAAAIGQFVAGGR